MSRQQTGRSSGLTGVVDLPGYSAKFMMSIGGWKVRTAGSTRPRRGRGGGVFASVRWIFSSGTGWAKGTINHTDAAWPAPDAWKGQTGTITIKVAAGKTVAYPIMITEAGFDFAGSDDEPGLYLAWELTGAPTYTGWSGTQPAASDPTKADQEQWGGRKTIDPDGLRSSATTIIDVYGTLADTDSAEASKLADVIAAAAAPMSDMKLRSASYQRDALDGGTILISWATTTTAEDVINAATFASVDPDGRDDAAGTAAMNGTPPAPADDTLFAGPTTTRELNDGNILSRKTWTRVTAPQAIAHSGTATASDPDNFAQHASVRDYRANATVSAPAAPVGKLVGYDIRPDRDANGTYSGRWIHDYFYGGSTPKNLLEQQGYFDADVAGLNDVDVQTLTGSSSTAPSDPSTRIAGLVIIRRRGIKLQDTPEKWKFIYTFGRLDAEQAIEHRGTSAAADIHGDVPGDAPTVQTDVDTCSAGDGTDDLLGTLVSGLDGDTALPWVSASIQKLHTTKFAQRVVRPADDKRFWWGEPRTGFERRALDATGAYLSVPIAYTFGTGQKKIFIAHWEHNVTRQVIRLRRYFRDDHIGDISFASLIGTRCSDAGGFLGKPQYTISYIGPAGGGNWVNDATSVWYQMDYLFLFCAARDSGGNIVDMNWTDSAIPRDQWYVTTASITVPGTPAASTVDSTFVVQTLANASYSSFLT